MKGNLKFWRKKRVLVTGHEGFLRPGLYKVLLELGAEIIGIDIVKKRSNYILKDLRKKIKSIQADVTELKQINAVINNYKPEIIFHLAAQAILGEAINIPIRTFKSNIEGTWNILESCRSKRFIEG